MVWESLSGWWLSHPSEKSEFVSWDDDIPNTWKNNPNVPNHQPVIHCNMGGAINLWSYYSLQLGWR